MSYIGLKTVSRQVQSLTPFWFQMDPAFVSTALNAPYALMAPRVAVFTLSVISSRNFLGASCAASFVASPLSHFLLALLFEINAENLVGDGRSGRHFGPLPLGSCLKPFKLIGSQIMGSCTPTKDQKCSPTTRFRHVLTMVLRRGPEVEFWSP